MDQLYFINITRARYSLRLKSKFQHDDWRTLLAIRLIDTLMYSLTKQFENYPDPDDENDSNVFSLSICDDDAWKNEREIISDYVLGYACKKENTELAKLLESIKDNFLQLKEEDCNLSIDDSDTIFTYTRGAGKLMAITSGTIRFKTESFDWRTTVYHMLAMSLIESILECISKYSQNTRFLEPLVPSENNYSIDIISKQFQRSKELKNLLRIVKKSELHKASRYSEH